MATSSDGVLEFLAAVHAADEQAARAAESPYGPWEHPLEDEGELNEVTIFPERGGATIVATTTPNPTGHAEAAHIARHDPQSVLARVQAERALVAMHEPVDLPPGPYGISANTFCRACADGGMPVQDERGTGWALWPCPSLRVLAWGYRGREGFDPAWTPDGAEARA